MTDKQTFHTSLKTWNWWTLSYPGESTHGKKGTTIQQQADRIESYFLKNGKQISETLGKKTYIE